jgi:hypothetical protein
MLARIILLLLQLAVGGFGAPYLGRYMPSLGAIDIFVDAVLFALLVTIVGFVGSLVLQGVATPTARTLTSAVVVALIFAALTFVPPITNLVSGFVPGLRPDIYPLIGAVLGYLIKR